MARELPVELLALLGDAGPSGAASAAEGEQAGSSESRRAVSAGGQPTTASFDDDLPPPEVNYLVTLHPSAQAVLRRRCDALVARAALHQGGSLAPEHPPAMAPLVDLGSREVLPLACNGPGWVVPPGEPPLLSMPVEEYTCYDESAPAPRLPPLGDPKSEAPLRVASGAGSLW